MLPLSLLFVSMYVFIEGLMEELLPPGLSLIKGRPLKYMTNARHIKKRSDRAELGP